jgi:starch-binding outer membrane protein, SusD/RagB family
MYGRMNRWAALGILSRVYLNAEVYTGTAQWNRRCWRRRSRSSRPAATSWTRRTVAVLAQQPYIAGDRLRGAVRRGVRHGQQLPHEDAQAGPAFSLNMNAQPWGGSAANPQFIDTYDPDDGRLRDTWLMGPHFDQQGRGYDFVKHVPVMTQTQFNHGFPVWKYEIYQGMTGSSDVDYPVVRYADVLLMRAEALLRTGDAAAAATLVTQVRQRNFTGAAAARAVRTAADLMRAAATTTAGTIRTVS